ncbi:MAG TPA: hypothetical protein VE685_05635 [Thermoanaerobaculia bacterium]|nr:hypothetical protein [Thermoanaerobaculia bacterium]
MADTTNPGAPENAEMTHEPDPEGVVSARDRFQGRYRRMTEDVRRGAERASAEIRRGTDTARQTYEEVSENARQTYTRVRSEAGNLSREVTLFVRDNPAKAVAIAAGVGFLLGLLVRRGRGDDEV